MSEEKQEWVLAGGDGLATMFLGKLAPGLKSADCLKQLAESGGSPVPLELFEARIILHQAVPLITPMREMSLQTLFKVMPFPANPDGAHVVLRATIMIDVEGDAPTKEMMMGQLKSCAELEQAEKAQRANLATGPSSLIRA